MHMKCKSAIAAAVTAGLIAAISATLAQAQQKYPTKPIRLVVAFTAGGVPDMLARSWDRAWETSWGSRW